MDTNFMYMGEKVYIDSHDGPNSIVTIQFRTINKSKVDVCFEVVVGGEVEAKKEAVACGDISSIQIPFKAEHNEDIEFTVANLSDTSDLEILPPSVRLL